MISKLCFPVLMLTSSMLYAQQEPAHKIPGKPYLSICVKLKERAVKDTLKLFVNEYYFNDTMRYSKLLRVKQLKTVAKKGVFRFQIKDFPANAYVRLQWKTVSGQDSTLLEDVLLELGDRLEIDAQGSLVSASGRGSERIHCLQQQKMAAVKAKKAFSEKYPKFRFGSIDERKIKPFVELYDMQEEAELKVLSQFKERLSPTAYGIMEADVLGYYGKKKYAIFASSFFPFNLPYPDEPITHYLLQLYKITLADRKINVLPEQELGRSRNYAEFVYEWIKCNESYTAAKKQDLSTKDIYGAIKKLPSLLGDKVRVLYLKDVLVGTANNASRIDSFLLESSSVVKNSYFKSIIDQWKSSFLRGAPMADFEFEDAQGKIVKLSEYKGKVIVMDMWFTGCGACVLVAKAMPKVEEMFKNREVVFISLSADKDRSTWLKSIDPNKKVRAGTPYSFTHYTTPSTHYLHTGSIGFDHPFLKRYNTGNGYPRLLLIDKEFKLYASSPPRPQAEDGQALIRLINEVLTKK